MYFKAIAGYDAIKKSLIHKVQHQQLPPAQLFVGTTGTPSLAFALALATYLLCPEKTLADACSVCPSCTKMHKLIHPDLHFAFPIGPTQKIKGKDLTTGHFLPLWRTFLQQNPYAGLPDWSVHLDHAAKQLQIALAQAHRLQKDVSLKPTEGTCKVALLWLPELLHKAAANALLKTLEEPPSQTFFVLVTQDVQHVLGTIRSRTLLLHFPPFTDQALTQALQHKYPAQEAAQLAQIVKMAQGDFNKAQQMATQASASDFASVAHWLRMAYKQDFTHLLVQAEAFKKQPLQLQKGWAAYALRLIRAALVLRFSPLPLAQLEEREAAFCQKLSQALLPYQFERMGQHLTHLYKVLARNANAKLAFISTSLQVAAAMQPPARTKG